MMRLTRWQWVVLGLPVAVVIGFLLVAAGVQIHDWGISWIWAVFTLLFVGWRLLLVKWTRPVLDQVEAVVAEVTEELEATSMTAASLPISSASQQAEVALQQVLEAARLDPPVWEDWAAFWQRCRNW